MKFTRAGEVHLGLRWRNEIAEIVIEDTGIGIAEADIERIFEPFERVEQPDTLAIHGVGLGLTITKLLTQILGGELTVTSTPGVGTRFCVRLMLPEARGRHLAPAPERRLLGYQGARLLTVLIADDDPVHRGLMEDLLSPLGFVLSSRGRLAQTVSTWLYEVPARTFCCWISRCRALTAGRWPSDCGAWALNV